MDGNVPGGGDAELVGEAGGGAENVDAGGGGVTELLDGAVGCTGGTDPLDGVVGNGGWVCGVCVVGTGGGTWDAVDVCEEAGTVVDVQGEQSKSIL